MKWYDLLDERQIKEVELALVYKTTFAHGTTGHNQLMLIARLAEILDKVETSGVPIEKATREEFWVTPDQNMEGQDG